MTFADLETPSNVLLVAFEPEEEAGAVFLRLRKAHRKRGLASWTLAPFLSNGARKLGASLVGCVPGLEASVLDRINPAAPRGATASVAAASRGRSPVPDLSLDESSVILVGERAAALSGTLSAVLRLQQRTGARVAWIPRRAGDRGAVEAGCLPNLLPGGRPLADPAARVDLAAAWGIESLPSLEGRDADEMLISASDDQLAALVVAGIDPTDFADPQGVLDGLEEVDFVVSLETRASLVTERADVVLPVSLMHERAGSFVNWEGRSRPFDVVIDQPNGAVGPAGAGRPGRRPRCRPGLPYAGAGPGRAGRARTLGGRARARRRTTRPAWPSSRASPPTARPRWCWPPGGCTWTPAGRWTTTRPCRRPPRPRWPGSARPRRPRPGSGRTWRSANDRGALTLPVVVDETMVDGVVWLPGRAAGVEVPEHLAAVAGDLVTIRPAANLVPTADRKVVAS